MAATLRKGDLIFQISQISPAYSYHVGMMEGFWNRRSTAVFNPESWVGLGKYYLYIKNSGLPIHGGRVRESRSLLRVNVICDVAIIAA